MQYISTRNPQQAVSAAEAICQGIASDGGLYVPQSFPAYTPASWLDLSYRQLAQEILALYFTDFTVAEITEIVGQAYDADFPHNPSPCVSVGDTEVLELFHGPTAAFKDFALQALPQLLNYAIRKTGRQQEVIILAATSGDTGKAALEAFKNLPGCRIIVFYPAGGVSPIQEWQMLTTGGTNTAVIAVDGSFDDCQNGLKKLFKDAAFQQRLQATGKTFSSANSINLGRLVPQIVYYYYAYAQMVQKGRIKAGEPIAVAVPTGNFGNLLACYYAQRMGLPVAKLICASNENDVLTETFISGRYNRLRPFYRTISPSMDILVSSNFERFLFEVYNRDSEAVIADLRALKYNGEFTIAQVARERWQSLLSAGSADQAQTKQTIAAVYQQYGYLLDPHTAVGWRVAKEQAPRWPLLVAATASPFKFPATVLQALGHAVAGLSAEQLLFKLADAGGGKPPLHLIDAINLPLQHHYSSTVADLSQTVAGLLELPPE